MERCPAPICSVRALHVLEFKRHLFPVSGFRSMDGPIPYHRVCELQAATIRFETVFGASAEGFLVALTGIEPVF